MGAFNLSGPGAWIAHELPAYLGSERAGGGRFFMPHCVSEICIRKVKLNQWPEFDTYIVKYASKVVPGASGPNPLRKFKLTHYPAACHRAQLPRSFDCETRAQLLRGRYVARRTWFTRLRYRRFPIQSWRRSDRPAHGSCHPLRRPPPTTFKLRRVRRTAAEQLASQRLDTILTPRPTPRSRHVPRDAARSHHPARCSHP
jgi:hypothetical protein